MSEDDKKNGVDEDTFDKTTLVSSDTFKVKLDRAVKAPPSLVLLMGPAGYIGKQWAITLTDMIIGRSVQSNVFVDDRSVSKTHAKLTVKNNDVFVMDLESTNKTMVNNQTLTPLVPVKLTNNDQLKTGNVIFKFLEKGSIESVSHQETFERGQIDPLTGAFNKGALISKGNEYFKRAKLLQVPLSIVVFDIDHFKKVNDTHGHQAGDYVLKHITMLVQNKLIRSGDVLARFGGEEFVVLLYGSTLVQAVDVAERIRVTVEKHNFENNGAKIPVTVSAGVATKTLEIESWDSLFERADKALYQSKEGGRNRVSTL